jgi:hypothetical protein
MAFTCPNVEDLETIKGIVFSVVGFIVVLLSLPSFRAKAFTFPSFPAQVFPSFTPEPFQPYALEVFPSFAPAASRFCLYELLRYPSFRLSS